MSNRQRGFTLVEMIIAIVVLGVGLAGVLLAFQQTTRGSASPLVNRQLLAIAEGMLEEALSRPFQSALVALPNGCARDGLHDIDDYNGFSNQPICPIHSNVPIAALQGYTVSVTVLPAALAGIAVEDARRITVIAQRSDGERLELVGWRTDYAKP